MARHTSNLAHYSRDRGFLVRAFFTLVLAFGVAGLGLSEFRKRSGTGMRIEIASFVGTPDLEDLESLFLAGRETPEAQAATLRHCAFLKHLRAADLHPDAAEISDLLSAESTHQAALAVAARAGETNRETGRILALYADALYLGSDEAREAGDALAKEAAAPAPPRFACECAADALTRLNRDGEAAPLFRREIETFPQSRFARAGLVEILLSDPSATAELRELLGDRNYGRALDSQIRLQAGLRTASIGEVSRALLAMSYENVTPALLAVTLFGGLVWFVIVTKLGGVRGLREMRFVYCAVAVLLGMASAQATLLAVVLQEEWLGLHRNGEFLNDLVFYVAGVGLREETLKLLFLVPLIPFVLRRKSEAEMLAVAACVGLGFAIEENVSYFSRGEGGFLGRMITANFLHISLTGAAGLALFRFCRWPRTRWEEFLGTYVAAVILHGLYDALISLPEFQHIDVIALLVFAGIAHRYFHLVAETREHGLQTISPLGVFVIGCALLIGGAWMFATWTLPLRDAVRTSGRDVLGVAMIGFLYVNQFRNE